MKLKTILFPCDFSTAERAAFDYATELARENGASLLIAHVEEPPTVYGEGSFYYGVPEPDHADVRKMLAEKKPANAAVRYEHHLLEGDPALEIATLAETKKVDLIVMSSHGRTGVARLVLGSIAEAVMRRAPCPVLIVKPSVTLRTDAATSAAGKRK